VDEDFDTVGQVISGDIIGEEGLYEVNSYRKDTAVAEVDTYLMEFNKDVMI